MPFFQNRRNIIIIICLLILLPVLVSLLILKYEQFQKKHLQQITTSSPAPVKIAIPSTPPSKVDLKKDLLSCPSIPDFCANAKDVNQHDTYLGIGTNLAKGSPVYAAFDGELSSLSGKIASGSAQETITIIYLDNKDKGIRAVYTLKGQTPQPKTVKEGDTISKVGDKINLFGSSLLFKLIKGNPLNGEVIRLSVDNFTK